MLDISPPNLLREIDAAEKIRDKHLRNILVLVKRYIGNWFQEGVAGKPVPENMIFSYVATMLPQLVFNNPAVAVSAKRSATDGHTAGAMEAAINAWIREVDIRDELERVCLNMILGFGVMKVGIEARSDFSSMDGRPDANGVYGRFTMEALTPYLFSVDPAHFFMDSQAADLSQCRLIGHQFNRDLDDLKGDDRYDQEVVGKLTADGGGDSSSGGLKPLFKPKRGAIERNRVTIHEIYLPEYRQICAICRNAAGEGQYLRPPQPYIGPADGPYILFGVYGVPGSPYPLSPVAAMAEQAEELNAHAVAAAREAAAHKKLIITDANQPGVTEAVQRSESGNVVSVPGFSPQSAMTVELGGTSQMRMAYIDNLRNRLDRVIGFSDAQRGRAASVTATEASIVNNAADDRTSFLQMKFRDAVKDALTRAAWFMYHDPSVVMAVSMQGRDGTQNDGLFLGGVQPGQEGTDWYDYRLDLEPYSMKRIDAAARQAQSQQLLQLALLIAPAMIQFPFINWRAILDDLGEAAEMPDYAEQILNARGMAMLQQGQMPMMPGQPPVGGAAGPMPMQPPGMSLNPAAGAPVNPPGQFAPQQALPLSAA